MSAVLCASAVVASDARAAVIVAATEDTGGVRFDASGSLNLSALLSIGSSGVGESLLIPNQALLVFGSPSDDAVPVDGYTGIRRPALTGAGNRFSIADSADGPGFGVFDGVLFVPDGYASGEPIAAGIRFDGEDFASLGLPEGEHRWTWGEGDTADAVILRVGVVPEPAAGGLAAAGLLLLARRRR